MANKVYDIITDRMIQQLEAGTVPWHKPWNSRHSGEIQNLVSKKPYRGMNIIMLGSAGYGSPYWMSFKQAKQLGGSVIKGEKGWPVTFWKISDRAVEDEETGETKLKKSFILRYYTVFNLEQVEGIDPKKIPDAAEEPDFSEEHTPCEVAETIIENMQNKPTIGHGGNRACYAPAADRIQMPEKAQFNQAEEYYSTLFHELGHATMHKSRLNRDAGSHIFGSKDYSKEELVAEMTAAFLCGTSGIIDAVFDNSAAYIKGWLSKLKSDKKILIQAAGQAQKAADYIQNVEQVQQQQTA